MQTPFELPDGVTWREVTDDDMRWLGAFVTWREATDDDRDATKRAEAVGGDPEPIAAINIRVTIRHPDGREREFVDGWYPFRVNAESRETLLQHITYQWQEGNFGCDCNRALFFARAGQEAANDGVCGRLYRVVAPAWLADGADE